MYDFHARFTGNSLLDAGTMGLNSDGRVVALGDFNGDQFLDALWLSNDQRTLSVYLWSHADFAYKASDSFRHPNVVYNVVPGDFTHTGKLDILVMSRSQTNGQMDLSLYPALPTGGFGTHQPSYVPPPSALPQPVPIDVNGDMKIDLLGMTPSSAGNSRPLRAWQNVWNASEESSPLFETRKDLFLVCDDGRGKKSFQIWVNNKSDGFSLAQEGSLPPGTQSISFADIDRDGTIDMVFPTCTHVDSSTGIGSDCSINIAFNQQLKLCSSSTDSGVRKGVRTCRPPEALCTADPNFKFDLSPGAGNNALITLPLSAFFPDVTSPSLLVFDTTYNPPLPVPLKLGDANLDGFPDFILILVSRGDHIPKLVFSVPCGSGDSVGCVPGRRAWRVARKGAELLDSIKDARGVSFLDMDEDGTLDIMVQRTGKAGLKNILFVQNNFYYDAFFLKAIVLNGACDNGLCHGSNGSEYHPFGVSYSGASFKYTVLDTSGHRSAAQVGQLPQTSYHALQTPYSFFGLGRTNNYIENLFVGSTIHANQHFINMEGVIPNSKVVILPSAKDGEIWKRQLFLRPGEWIPWVTLTVIVGTILLAVIVFILHLNEKREDELERRRASHHINFDAL
ncbi:hypothetical protein BD779DRAFT_1609403 [Infundibulicybe gibba]|nr:hypothetical protein BD779DRAFT_1609403 [Infundibulicybe gibba]